MYKNAITPKYFTRFLGCASLTALLVAATPADAAKRSSALGAWKTGVINVAGANGMQYCSMKAGFDNGTTLVWARDEARQNSLAIDFDESALQVGEEYYVALEVKGGEYREYLAKAASDRVLIMQLGNDDGFFTSLRNKNTLAVDMDGVSLSYSLKGTKAGLSDLDKCVAKIAGEPLFETADAGHVQFTPKNETPASASSENAELRAELERLKSEKEALEKAQNDLIAEKEEIAAAQAKEAMESETASMAVEAHKEAAAEAQEKTVLTEMPTEQTMIIEEDVAEVETTSPEQQKVQSTIEKSREIAALVRQIETLRLEKEALSDKQMKTEQQLAKLDKGGNNQMALLAEVESLRAANKALETEAQKFKSDNSDLVKMKEKNEALTAALSEKDQVIIALSGQAGLTPEGREISILKSELDSLRGRLAVFERNKSQNASECRVAELPKATAEQTSSLKDVILAAELATDADLVDHSDVITVSYSWKTGDVDGTAKEYDWPIHTDFTAMAEEYVASEKEACNGAFSRVFGKSDLIAGVQVMEAELTCVTEQGPYASVLFFYGGQNKFTVLEQEAKAKEMRTALENRKKIFNVVLPQTSN